MLRRFWPIYWVLLVFVLSNYKLGVKATDGIISFDNAKNSFLFNLSTGDTVEFSLCYQHEKTENVVGNAQQGEIYAGTCSSGGTCIPHLITRGIFKYESEAVKFVIKNGLLEVVSRYQSESINLDDKENYWLQNGVEWVEILINEFVYNPKTGEKEWVELINQNQVAVGVSGWKLVDESNSAKNLSGTIPAMGFLVYENASGWLNNTGSSNTGDTVFLKIGNTVIDQVCYSRIGPDFLVNGIGVSSDLINLGMSVGRSPDGMSTWQIFGAATKGYLNATPTVTQTPSPTPMVTFTPTPTVTQTPSPTPMVTFTPTPTVTQMPSPTPMVTFTPTPGDTTEPIIEIIKEELDGRNLEVEAGVNETVANCWIEREGIDNGTFESGNIGYFESGGSAAWYADNSVKLSGDYSARSGDLSDLNLAESWIKQTITLVNPARVKFWWRVSSEADWDFLKFYIDGYQQNMISGTNDWGEQIYDLVAGTHVLTWSYTKDYSGKAGSDAGWIDDISIFGIDSRIVMLVTGKQALGRLSDLPGGVSKYRVGCEDLAQNQGYSPYQQINIVTPTVVPTLEPTATMIPLPTPTATNTPDDQEEIEPTATLIPVKTEKTKVLGVKDEIVPTSTIVPVITENNGNKPVNRDWTKFFILGVGGIIAVVVLMRGKKPEKKRSE